MATLPTTPFIIHGGYFCRAITYKISVPALESRSLIPTPPNGPSALKTKPRSAYKSSLTDHCNSCCRISGTIVECWFICPQSWTTFSLLSRDLINNSGSPEARITPKSTSDVLRPSKEVEESASIKAFQSSDHTHREFCGRCGTHLTFLYSGDDDEMTKEENWEPHFDVAVGTFEKECVKIEGMRPGRLSWWDEGIGWVKAILGEGEKSFKWLRVSS